MLPLGTPAPDFALPDPEGRTWRRADLGDAEATVVMFLCNHCPFVKHIAEEIAQIARDYAGRPVAFVAINSNDAVAYPDDAPAKMADHAREWGFTFPYLFDESQDTAKAYRAACTPDFYIFDRSMKLAYRGQLDGSRPGNGVPVTGADLRAAIDALLGHRQPTAEQHPSIGCNIKWKPGHAPPYATA
jgi:thiol-disulfide isomerase/thioredoxin